MFNKKDNFEELFKKEFKKANKVDINIHDFLPKEELKQKKQVSISWKYATLLTVFLLAISSIMLSIGISKYNELDFVKSEFKYIQIDEDNNALKEEDFKKMLEICKNDVIKENAYYIDITKDISLYVYKGSIKEQFVNSSLEVEMIYKNIYFYAFKFKDDRQKFDLLIDEYVFNIDSENNFGILGYVVVGNEVNIEFDIVYRNKVKNYIFDECK